MSNRPPTQNMIDALIYVATHGRMSTSFNGATAKALIARGYVIGEHNAAPDAWAGTPTQLTPTGAELVPVRLTLAIDTMQELATDPTHVHAPAGFLPEDNDTVGVCGGCGLEIGRVGYDAWTATKALTVGADPEDPFYNIPNAGAAGAPSQETPASASDLDTETLLKAAREAMKRPESFGYFGSKPLFVSWGITLGKSDASVTVEISNYRVFLREVIAASELDGDDPDEWVEEMHASHWLVGHTDSILVRVLVDEEGEVTADNLSHTFVRAAEMAHSLQDYGVLDESDWSDAESAGQEESYGSIEGQIHDEIMQALGLVHPLTIEDATLNRDSGTVRDLMIDGGTIADLIREAYLSHDLTEWVEEAGTGWYNTRHVDVVADLVAHLFVKIHAVCPECGESVRRLDNGTYARHTGIDWTIPRTSFDQPYARKHCHASGTATA